MKPDKTGYYWFETRTGDLEIADVREIYNNVKKMSIGDFEGLPRFLRWVSPVCPPKSVHSFYIDDFDECGVGKQYKVVLYEDIEEYVI